MNDPGRSASRLRGRRMLIAGGAVGACVGLWASSLVIPSWTPSPRVASSAPARQLGLRDLNGALARADRFLSSLYKPLGPRSAVMSEYYGLPLRVYLNGDERWVLVGERRGVVAWAAASYDTERSIVRFRSSRADRSPELEIAVDWDATPSRYAIEIVNARFQDASTTADLYLGDIYLGRLGRSNVGASFRRSFRKSENGDLRSLRFTIRHATQQARHYFAYRSQHDRSAHLANVIRASGFGLDYDAAVPIWGGGRRLADPMPFDGGPGGSDAYHDCDAVFPSSSRAYPYRSKVCLARRAYVWNSHSDTLAAAAQGIHLLNKYSNPDKSVANEKFPLALPVGWDPRSSMPNKVSALSIARELEAKFRRQHVGIPACVFPSYCLANRASGVRTFQFGALETLLGYRFGDRVARSYADAVAHVALGVQVRDDGVIRSDVARYYRPAAVGSFYLNWDRRLRLSAGRGLRGQSVARGLYARLEMPPEYRGVIASNAETTLTAYAFLVLYRCERFGVGCRGSGRHRAVAFTETTGGSP